MKTGSSITLPLIHNKSSYHKGDGGRGMREVHKSHERLKEFVEDLNDHVNWLMSRKQFMLQGRYYSILQQLNETRKALVLYEKGIRNLERQIEEDPKIKSMKAQIKFFEEYSGILAGLHQDTDQEVELERQKIAEYRRILADKKKALNSRNHNNIQLASQISKLRNVLGGLSSGEGAILPIEFVGNEQNNIKSALRSPPRSYEQVENEYQSTADQQQVQVISSALPIDQESEQDYESASQRNQEKNEHQEKHVTTNNYFALRKSVENLVKKNTTIKKGILLSVNDFNDVYALFLEAFHKYEDVLHKSQMIVHNQGLNGSLIFLLLNSKKTGLDQFSPIALKDNRFFEKKQNVIKPFQKQQDGEVIDVIYSTFQRMLENEEKKNDKVKEMVSAVQLEQLMTFSPLQMMGLVLLKPEVLRDLINEFDEKKRRLMSLSSGLKGIKISVINK